MAASRAATKKEHKVLAALLAQSGDYYRKHPADVEKLLRIGLKPAPPQLDAVELASWTIVARATLNLNEVTTRN
jgi:hypothetical protein